MPELPFHRLAPKRGTAPPGAARAEPGGDHTGLGIAQQTFPAMQVTAPRSRRDPRDPPTANCRPPATIGEVRVNPALLVIRQRVLARPEVLPPPEACPHRRTGGAIDKRHLGQPHRLTSPLWREVPQVSSNTLRGVMNARINACGPDDMASALATKCAPRREPLGQRRAQMGDLGLDLPLEGLAGQRGFAAVTGISSKATRGRDRAMAASPQAEAAAKDRPARIGAVA